MSVMVLEGYVEDGQIRLRESAELPEKSEVYVVVTDAAPRASRVWSPRLAEFRQIEQFSMEVTDASSSESTGPDACTAELERLIGEIEILRDVRQAEQQMEAGLGIPHADAKAQVMESLKH